MSELTDFRGNRDTQLRIWADQLRPKIANIISMSGSDTRHDVAAFNDFLKLTAASRYEEEVISYRDYASILLISKCIDLLVNDDAYNGLIAENVLYGLFEFSWSERELNTVIEASRLRVKREVADANRSDDRAEQAQVIDNYFINYEKPTLADAAMRIPSILLNFSKRTLLRYILSYAYGAYQPKLKEVFDAHDAASWVKSLNTLLAHVSIRHFVPLYQSIFVRSPNIIIPPDGQQPAFDAGEEREVSALFKTLFDERSIAEFKEEERRCAELFAHAIAAAYHGVVPEWFEEIAGEIEAIARTAGRLRARQALLLRYKGRLAIPKYIYEKINQTLLTQFDRKQQPADTDERPLRRDQLGVETRGEFVQKAGKVGQSASLAGPMQEPTRALFLMKYARERAAMGDREGARATAQEAAGLYCALAKEQPEVFARDYGETLGYLASLLTALGQRKEAAVFAGAALAQSSRSKTES